MSTNSRIKTTYRPKHFDPSPEKVWEKIESKLSSNQEEDEDNEETEFTFSDLSSNDE